ncbi:pentapeptide repeat-containing protein [Streptomyces sp. Caat 7-52]|uniref:pentapeptide repeat-containing protein n=1 Tax=Streptomyces sp. Caat 7-52 TaxID=2949637 RepID=UPI002034BAAD|nr:pentapeptide repeat-containing protein [Streptomyces sp. Caat 7-52]
MLIAISVGLLLVAVFSWHRLAALALRIQIVPLLLVIAAAACAAAAGKVYRRTRPQQESHSAPPIRWWWAVLAFTAVGAAVWISTALLMPQTDGIRPNLERTKQRIDVVRTSLAAGAGVGAAVTVLLAFRRQHHHEKATEQTEHDATERRITELYTQAVEQLGSSQAPVRLGGLYALERLGQTAPTHRQTIVDVICAYLRMPYTPPTDSVPTGQSLPAKLYHAAQAARALPHRKANAERRQELQVRMTAQRILAAHLHDKRPQEEQELVTPNERFWEGSRIDLNHATLIDFDFRNCHMAQADFRDATFPGSALFKDATFDDLANFTSSAFDGSAVFTKSTFKGSARFADSTFKNGGAWFREATFDDEAVFMYATFDDIASFKDATFNGDTLFAGARVTRLVPPLSNEMGLSHEWPPGWTVSPAPGGGGTLQEVDTQQHEEP